MKKLLLVPCAVALSIGLAGCGFTVESQEEEKKPVQTQPAQPEINTPVDEETRLSDLTEEEMRAQLEVFIKVNIEGFEEERKAYLSQDPIDNYELAVLDGYTLIGYETYDSIEFENDKEFHADIQKLVSDKTIEEVKQQIEDIHYNDDVNINELDPKELFDSYFHDSELYLLVEVNQEVKKDIIYVVKEIKGEKFAFALHIPSKEAAEGVIPSFWAMLKTLNQTENLK